VTGAPTWSRGRDDYGRSVHYLTSGMTFRTLGVVVRLPKAAIETHDGCKYLVNNWSLADRDAAVSYARTLSEAKRRLIEATR
jgi:hypothetical protein